MEWAERASRDFFESYEVLEVQQRRDVKVKESSAALVIQNHYSSASTDSNNNPWRCQLSRGRILVIAAVVPSVTVHYDVAL